MWWFRTVKSTNRGNLRKQNGTNRELWLTIKVVMKAQAGMFKTGKFFFQTSELCSEDKGPEMA